VWSRDVPTFATSSGIVMAHPAAQPSGTKPMPAMPMAVFFFPPVQLQNLRLGESIRLHVNSSGLQLNTQITSIDPNVMNPTALRSRFHLENAALLITQPSAAVEVKLDPAFAAAYEGSVMTADVQVGSRRLVSLLPGVGGLFGK